MAKDKITLSEREKIEKEIELIKFCKEISLYKIDVFKDSTETSAKWSIESMNWELTNLYNALNTQIMIYSIIIAVFIGVFSVIEKWSGLAKFWIFLILLALTVLGILIIRRNNNKKRKEIYDEFKEEKEKLVQSISRAQQNIIDESEQVKKLNSELLERYIKLGLNLKWLKDVGVPLENLPIQKSKK